MQVVETHQALMRRCSELYDTLVRKLTVNIEHMSRSLKETEGGGCTIHVCMS